MKKYFNHINNNLLVTKSGFHSLTYRLMEKGIKIHEFIPVTFELPYFAINVDRKDNNL